MTQNPTPSPATPSSWQTRITGDWHGLPSVFDADGTHVGTMAVSRASTFVDGRTTYTMDTALDVRGPLRARFEAAGFSFGVADGERDRVYLGPDFVGAGHPAGDLVDAHYYSPGWQADLRTRVQIMPDAQGEPLQVYSSLLHEGPTMLAVFNGLYRQAPAGGVAAAALDAFRTSERVAGPRSHVLPFKHAGQWTGTLAVHAADGGALAPALARVDYQPRSLLAAETTVTLEGAVNARWRATRRRQGNRHVWDGPDLWGNAIGYGRALYTSQHVFGQALKIRGREFLLDDHFGLAVVWQVLASDRLRYTVHGRLAWEPREQVLVANHDAGGAA
jgi:hypothetical protein